MKALKVLELCGRCEHCNRRLCGCNLTYVGSTRLIFLMFPAPMSILGVDRMSDPTVLELLDHVGDVLKADPGFMKRAVRLNPNALSYVVGSALADQNVARAALASAHEQVLAVRQGPYYPPQRTAGEVTEMISMAFPLLKNALALFPCGCA